MGINLNTIEFIFNNKNVENKDIIFVGDHRISFNRFPNELIKKFKFDDSINLKIRESKVNGIEQKKFFTKIFKSFGFNKLIYLENFKSDCIDFKIDLSQKNSTEKIKQKFGIVVDNGTSIYSSNIIYSLENIINLVDTNGYLLTNLDPMSFNRFPMQPAPETLLDLMTCNGLKTDIFVESHSKNKLLKRKKYELSYFSKHKLITEYLSLSQFFFHIIFLIKNFIFFKKKNLKKIYSEDYISIKRNKFRDLQNEITIKKNDTQNKKYLIKNIIKKIFSKVNQFIDYKGCVSISFEAKKIEANLNLKKNSSTIYYSMLNDN